MLGAAKCTRHALLLDLVAQRNSTISHGGEDFALAARAGPPLDPKAHGLKGPPHRPAGAVRGKASAGDERGVEAREEGLRPQLRVGVGREGVEVDGVEACA